MKNTISTETRKNLEQANMVFAFHSPKSTDKKVYAAKVLMTLMASGMSSKLFHKIREEKNLVYTIFGNVSTSKNFSHSYIYAGAKKENVDLIRKIILEEFEKVSKKLTKKEFADVKKQLIGNYKISMENSEDQAHQLLLHEVDGNAKRLYEFEKNIRDVKISDVKKLAIIKKYSFFALTPE